MNKFYEDFYKFIVEEDSDIESIVVSDNKGSAFERMTIYRNAYLFRLIDILFEEFETVHKILGDEEFVVLAQGYLKKFRPTSYTVRDLGDHLATYLKTVPPYCDHPYLSEVADFEWKKRGTFDGPDSVLFSAEDLQQLDSDKLPNARFIFQPTVKRLVFEYDVPQIWKAIQEDNLDKEPSKMPHPLSWVMWRKELSPHWISLDVDADWALQEAMAGASFADICAGLTEWIDEEHVPARAASFIRTWIDEHMLESIET